MNHLTVARQAWRIVLDLADRLGDPIAARSATDLFVAVAGVVPAMAGRTLDAVGPFGVKL